MEKTTPNAYERAQIITEALPHMQHYDGQIVVVKYGGHAMGDADLARAFARNIVLLRQAGMRPVVVHGGGPQIGAMLERLGVESSFKAGLRVTDDASIEVVEMVLSGITNKSVVSILNDAGGQAVGISGKDGRLIVAEKLKRMVRDTDSHIEQALDLGYVGKPVTVNPKLVIDLLECDFIPVVAPVAADKNGITYNINADTVACALAGALKAKRLLYLTDVPGVLNKDNAHLPTLTIENARELIADGTITGGMIPKVENCIEALELGVDGVVILNGRVPHAVLLELFTEEGAGTLFVK